MSGEDKVIRIKIDSKKGKSKNIPVTVIAELLNNTQNLLCNIVDDIEGNPPRKGGDFPYTVKERCELVVKMAKIGSFDAVLAVSDTQSSLPGSQTKGELAIIKANNIIEVIFNEDKILPKIKLEINNEKRIEKILDDIYQMCPDPESEYNIAMGFGGNKIQNLNPERKQKIKSALYRQPTKFEKVIIGRLMELRVDRKRQFQVDTDEGIITCQYTPDIENEIIKSLRNIVKVQGTLVPDKKGKFILQINDNKSIEPLSMYPLKEVKLKDKIRELKIPLQLDVNYYDEEYIVINKDIGLRVISKTMKEALEGISEQIDSLWSTYVEADTSMMNASAKELRKKLISLFKEDAISDLL